jgi:2'-5' RNA ligase
MARLFFALWPANAARDELARLARRVAAEGGGRAVPAQKIHLTLAFLGEVSDPQARLAAGIAATLKAAPFVISVDRIGSFGRSGVAWAGMSNPPEALLGLAHDLAQGLRQGGFRTERRAFAAHLTLARSMRGKLAAALAPVLRWESKGFSLVASDLRTGRYAEIEAWPLEGGAR